MVQGFQSYLSHLEGGIIQRERMPLPQMNTEPATLYVGNPDLKYPKSLLAAVHGTKGGKIDFHAIISGAKKCMTVFQNQ